MATDTLEIFGTEYTGVTGIKATDDQSGTKVYIRPQGTKSISANGTGIDVAEYASVDVNVSSGTPRTSTDLVVSGATVTAPAGVYATDASKSVASGTAGTPTATKGTVSNHQVSVTPSVTNTTGYITGSTINGTAVTVSASELVSGTYNVTSSGTKDVTNYASASVPAGTAGTPSASKGAVSNHSVSVTPSVTNTTGWITGSTKTGTAVTVTASELASGNKAITQNGTNIDVVGYSTVSVDVRQQFTATIENNGAASGYNYAYVQYNNTNYYTASDTFTFSEGDTLTCLADARSGTSKIYVNDEEVKSGYTISYAYSLPASDITIQFSAVSSGSSVKIYTVGGATLITKTITSNGTYNASSDSADGYSSVTVNVPSGSSKNVQVLQSTSRTNASSLTKVLGDLTVSKTGTYDVYWSGGRSNTSTSYTWGTRLYVDGTGYGTENTTWTNNCQSNHLSNVSLTANQKLSVYARGRTGSYYTFAPMLVIIEA